MYILGKSVERPTCSRDTPIPARRRGEVKNQRGIHKVCKRRDII